MSQRLDEEIRQQLKNWPTLFKHYAQPDTRKAVIQLLNTFLPFIGLWILMYFSLSWSYWVTLALAVVNAFFLVRIFIIQHDCGHRSFLASQTWNRIIGWFCSLFSIIPFRYWARVHDFHHGHSGQLEVRDIGDIKLMTVDEYRQAGRWERLSYRIFRTPVITFVIGPVIYLLWNNRLPLVRFKGWEAAYRALHWNNLLLLGVYVALGGWLGWRQFLLVQAPIVVLFAIIAVWFFYVQHQHEHSYKQWRDQWDYLLAAVRGSTFYNLPPVMHWLTGNISYHHIHHLNPLIPNYHLPRCARENPFLQRYVTTLTFRESLSCIPNKLWCEEEERMISLREFYRREKT